jgi:ribosomal protein S7
MSNRRILLKVFKKLSTFVEIKKIRVRKRLVYVPFYITSSRRMYLIIKWVMLAVKTDKRKIPFTNKIANEILSVLRNKSSKSMRYKKSNVSMVLSNRSNIHFRW